jgi:sulfate adenylyltransferase subunit 1
VLKDEIDISRGDLLVDAQVELPAVQSASVDVVWMAEQPLTPGQSYDIKIAGKKTRASTGFVIRLISTILTQRESVSAAERDWTCRLTFDNRWCWININSITR